MGLRTNFFAYMRRYIFLAICIVFVFWSFYPSLYEIAHRDKVPVNRQFELSHNFYTDFNFYLSRIRQGIEGNKTVVEKYTSESHNGSFIQAMYLGMGWIGGWVRTPWHRSADVYHVGRIVLGMALLLTIAYLCRRSFGSFWWQMAAFLLVVTAGTWPKPLIVDGGWRFGGFMPWWTVMDIGARITFVPHILAGQALIIFLITAFSDSATIKRYGNWIFLGMLGCLLGLVFPPGLLFVWGTLGILACMEFVRSVRIVQGKKFRQWLWDTVAPSIAFVFVSAPSLVYLQLMTSFYPWKRLAEFDITRPLPFQYKEYFLAVGPILPLGIIGLLLALRKKDIRMRGVVAWVLAWAGFLWIFNYIPLQSPLRFSEMVPHVALGILAAYGGMQVIGMLGRVREKIQRHVLTLSVYVILVLSVVSGLGLLYSSALWWIDGVKSKQQAAWPLVPTGGTIVYPLKDFISAMIFIQDTTSRDTPVLSETTAGNYIPVFAGNSVYVGHANTIYAEQKQALVKEFFSGRMSSQDAREWMEKEHLSIVYFGPQEKEDGNIQDIATVYPFLKSAYKNSYVTVYTRL